MKNKLLTAVLALILSFTVILCSCGTSSDAGKTTEKDTEAAETEKNEEVSVSETTNDENMAQETENAAVICYDEQLPHLRRENAIPSGGETDLETQAHRLFYALRAADSLPCGSIYANLPPSSGLGLALYNRLIRAAAYRIEDADTATDIKIKK